MLGVARRIEPHFLQTKHWRRRVAPNRMHSRRHADHAMHPRRHAVLRPFRENVAHQHGTKGRPQRVWPRAVRVWRNRPPRHLRMVQKDQREPVDRTERERRVLVMEGLDECLSKYSPVTDGLPMHPPWVAMDLVLLARPWRHRARNDVLMGQTYPLPAVAVTCRRVQRSTWRLFLLPIPQSAALLSSAAGSAPIQLRVVLGMNLSDASSCSMAKVTTIRVPIDFQER